MKLMLGGRNHKIEGFLNIDVHEGPNVDVRGDISDLSAYADKSVSEIYASHCLEHFPHTRTKAVLSGWRRVLDEGGVAYISVPDFEFIVHHYLTYGLTPWVRAIGWGDQWYKEAFHYTAFDFESLKEVLNESGFSSVERINEMPYGLADCSRLTMPRTGERVSVNVEARP